MIRVDVFNLSRRSMFVREWSGHLAYEYAFDTKDPLQLGGGRGRRTCALTCQPRYTRVAGCDASTSEGQEWTWEGRGCAILTATAEIGPFKAPGILKAKVSIPRTDYFLRGGTGTHYIEYQGELPIDVVASEPETQAAHPPDADAASRTEGDAGGDE